MALQGVIAGKEMRITKYFDIVQEEGKLCAEEGDSRFHGNDEHQEGSAMTLLNTWLFKESAGKERKAVRRRGGFPFSRE